MRRPAHAILISLSAALLGGCTTGGKGFANENDKLRAQVLDLETEVRTLKGRNDELMAHLKQASSTPSAVPADVAANTPHVTSISISRLSQALDSNGDGRIDSILIYMEPRDGLGRFLQIVGSVSMHAAILPADGSAITIGRKTIGPGEVRDGYRSAFTGQYYSLTLPIDPPKSVPAPASLSAESSNVPAPAAAPTSLQCTVRVEFTDGYTGQKFSAERVIDLQ